MICVSLAVPINPHGQRIPLEVLVFREIYSVFTALHLIHVENRLSRDDPWLRKLGDRLKVNGLGQGNENSGLGWCRNWKWRERDGSEMYLGSEDDRNSR